MIESEDDRASARPAADRLDVVVPAVATLVLLAVLMLISWRRPYFWYDEAVSRLLVSDPSATHMLRVIAAGGENNPPLYPLLLRAWGAVAGTSTLAMRLPSALLVIGAFAILWRPLRRHAGAWVAAIALALTFFRADAILDQVAQARFYGLFLFAAASAIACALAAAERGPPRWLMLATMASHTTLLYAHTFGIAYSAAIASASLFVARRARAPWRPTVLAVAAAWVLFAPWLPAVIEQGRMAEPRLWIAPPEAGRLIGVMERLTSRLSLLLVTVAGLRVAWLRWRRAPRMRREIEPLVAVGAAVAAIVPLAFLESRVGVPVFVDRYLLPSALGWPLLVAASLRRLLPTRPARWHAVAGAAAYAGLAGSALSAAASRESWRPPIPPLVGRAGTLPVVVESAIDFLPLVLHDGDRVQYRFPLDWELAVDPTNAPASVQEYKLMALFARAGYLREAAVDGMWMLCETPEFVVVNSPQHHWLERRLLQDGRWIAHPLDAGRTLWMVKRRAPHSCDSKPRPLPEVHPAPEE